MAVAEDLADTFGGKWDQVTLPGHGFQGVVDDKAAGKMKNFFDKFCVDYKEREVDGGVSFFIPGPSNCVTLLGIAKEHYGHKASTRNSVDKNAKKGK